MRRRSWAYCRIDFLRLVLLVVSTLFMAPALAERSVAEIRLAEFTISDASTPPIDASVWQPTALPHRSTRPVEHDLTAYWYRLNYLVDAPAEPVWLLFPKLRSGGNVYVNGLIIGRISQADALTQRRWFRPYMFVIPPVALRQGTNVITVQLAIREPLTSFGEVFIGGEEDIRPMYDRLLFWENTVTEVASFLCLIVGGLTLLIWVRRRQEALYGMFSVCALFWGVRTLVFRMAEVPMSQWVAWRFMYYFTTAGFIVCISLFMLRLSECVRPRLERLMFAYWLVGCAAFLVIGVPARQAMDGWWTLGFLPFTLYSVVMLVESARRTRSASATAMLGAVAFAFTLALHDFAVQHGLFGVAEFYLLHLGIPAFLLVMALVLLERFLKTLQLADSLHDSLAAKVAERERALLKSHERLRRLERLNATAEERQRIMQNLHDGVGSQLITSLILVKGGSADQAQIVSLLQDCIDEMRLALDSMSAENDELIPVLGSFKARILPRFIAMGLRLDWANENLPASLQVPPHATLQVLRVLQEALANVLKHAMASTVSVRVGTERDTLVIIVKDDGVGMPGPASAGGHGVGNMRTRASKMGATLDVFADETGTTVRLSVPLVLANMQPGNDENAAGVPPEIG